MDECKEIFKYSLFCTLKAVRKNRKIDKTQPLKISPTVTFIDDQPAFLINEHMTCAQPPIRNSVEQNSSKVKP